VIAGFEAGLRNALLFKATPVRPLGAILSSDACAVCGIEVHPRMGISQVKGDNVSFECDLLFLLIVLRKGMVCVGGRRHSERADAHE
jgi:hypothetical protein